MNIIKKEYTFDIILKLSELNNINENIMKKIKYYENKNINDIYGHLKKIIKIKKIITNNIIKTNFNGDIFCNVICICNFINPQMNEIIDCTIQENNNILIGVNDIYKIIIVENIKDLKIGTKVKVEILAKQIKLDLDYINIIGKLIE